MNQSMNRSGARPSQDAVRPRSAERRIRKIGTQNERGFRAQGFGRLLVTGLLAVSLVSMPSLALAGETAGEVSKESGLGAAAAVSSLIYGPAKLLYATGGLIVGGLAWAFTAGDSQVAEKVFTRSLRGTYVITPGILLGEERLEFIGRDIGVGETMAPASSVASATSAVETYGQTVEYGGQGYEQTYEAAQDSSKTPQQAYDDLGW